ncbi:ABC transporter permease [Desulfonema ishimotonii]|uniref:ABC transporter permease n=1 Tax=Desulfonema ishimotonii TaxID=45657 RepID=A0A401FY93_9BACT|nr:FtsX-like permease family protein [Desulfonema ishimotonii]GBC61914.1 ABC transporter permease [Desulfonema ishimotonii]
MKWIERQRCFLDFTLSCLWRRKWKNLSLLLVYTLVIFLAASVIFFAGAIRKEAQAVLAESPEIIIQRTVAGRHALMPTAYARVLEKIRGVRTVRARLWGYYYHPATGANYTLMVPEDFPHKADEVVVGEGVLRTWGTISENRLCLSAHNREAFLVTIAGTLDRDTALVSSDLILMAAPTFRRITGVPRGFATDLTVRVRNPAEYDTVTRKIIHALPDTRPIRRDEILRTYAAVFDWRSGYLIAMLSGTGLAFLIFAWDKATGLSAEERGEIGLLRGVGWDISDILMMKFQEGTAISLTAFVLGVSAAHIHVFFASAPLFEHALKGWAVLYPDFRLTPVADAGQMGTLFLLTVVPYTLMTLIPAWAVAITDPDTVMRQG